MNQSSVSVIIPTHNRWPQLRRALDSVSAQTVGVLETIVVDDGSDDETAERLGERKDSRVSVIRLAKNGGAAHARNVGLGASRGRLVAFLDSDDEWLPTYLETMLTYFDGPSKPLAACSAMIRRTVGRDEVVRPRLGKDGFETLLSERSPVCIAFVVDRQRIGGVRFDESLPAMEEHEFLLSLSRMGSIACATATLYVAHDDAADRVTNPMRHLLARQILLRKYKAELDERPHALANAHYRIARVHWQLGDGAGVRESLRLASDADPANVRLRILSVAAALGPFIATATFGSFIWLARTKRSVESLFTRQEHA